MFWNDFYWYCLVNADFGTETETETETQKHCVYKFCRIEWVNSVLLCLCLCLCLCFSNLQIPIICNKKYLKTLLFVIFCIFFPRYPRKLLETTKKKDFFLKQIFHSAPYFPQCNHLFLDLNSRICLTSSIKIHLEYYSNLSKNNFKSSFLCLYLIIT